MEYISTRGAAPVLGFEDVLITGLARDGGLYVPAVWPEWSAGELGALAEVSYGEAALRVMHPFMGGTAVDELAGLIDAAYAGFDHGDVAPLVALGDGHWLLELFHGPTLAFKDVALQFIGRLFDRVLSKRGDRVTIVVATSGDTGAAAIEACRERDAIDIFVLHPKGRTSEMQRRQMTCVLSPNVRNIAIEGTFDDCQRLVKEMFNDLGFRDELRLSALNSINWGRVMGQIVYYMIAAAKLCRPGGKVSFSVPTGNFGDVYAGYAAWRMGAPIERLVVATNRNDLLHRFFARGEYRPDRVFATQSPSMDIQLASNFERLLFNLHGCDGSAVRGLMQALDDDGGFQVSAGALATAREVFDSYAVDEAATTAAIAATYESHGKLIDPHTAVGLSAAQALARPDVPMVTLATAHAAKFNDAVREATGREAKLPPALADLLDRPERYETLANDLATVENYIRSELRGGHGA